VLKTVAVLIVFSLILGGGCVDRIAGLNEISPLPEEPEITVELPEGGEETLPLEQYIAGVVAAEMHEDWPVNAYGAQAIIARTFALSRIEEEGEAIISADFEEAQAYDPERITEAIERAVGKTRGQVAIYDGEYIRGWFHSHAGGRTTTARVGLGFDEEEPPYIHSVASPDFLGPNELQSWEERFTDAEIIAAVNEIQEDPINSIEEIKVREVQRCGRAKDFALVTDRGTFEVPAPDFRNALDSVKLKSTKINDIENVGNGFVFSGEGWGHGVGLSQWGALAMARRGNSPQDIVRYYFRGINIQQLYS